MGRYGKSEAPPPPSSQPPPHTECFITTIYCLIRSFFSLQHLHHHELRFCSSQAPA